MLKYLNPLRPAAAEHRDVFSEFAVLLVFVIADHLAMGKPTPRLRVTR